jgi:hypothetical protein
MRWKVVVSDVEMGGGACCEEKSVATEILLTRLERQNKHGIIARRAKNPWGQ